MKRSLLFAPLLCGLLLGGCALTEDDAGADSAEAPKRVTKADIANWQTSGTWKLVKKEPPTFFPNGVPADHPTGFRDGEWVIGDASQPRFFVPKSGGRGKDRDQLLAEATAIIESTRDRKFISTPSLPELPEVKMPSLPKLGGKKKEG